MYLSIDVCIYIYIDPLKHSRSWPATPPAPPGWTDVILIFRSLTKIPGKNPSAVG